MENEVIWVECTCHSCNVLRFEIDDMCSDPEKCDKPLKDSEGRFIFEFAVFKSLVSRSWKDRIRHIWKLLRTGEPFGDMMILDLNTIRKLKDKLTEKVAECDEILAESRGKKK